MPVCGRLPLLLSLWVKQLHADPLPKIDTSHGFDKGVEHHARMLEKESTNCTLPLCSPSLLRGLAIFLVLLSCLFLYLIIQLSLHDYVKC